MICKTIQKEFQPKVTKNALGKGWIGKYYAWGVLDYHMMADPVTEEDAAHRFNKFLIALAQESREDTYDDTYGDWDDNYLD